MTPIATSMRRLGLSLLSLMLSAPIVAGDTVGAGDATRDGFPLITKRVQSWVDRGYYPGCAVWIAKGNQVLYKKCFGSYTPDTEVYIASAGKWLASAVILAVVDEGKLSLDDPA